MAQRAPGRDTPVWPRVLLPLLALGGLALYLDGTTTPAPSQPASVSRHKVVTAHALSSPSRAPSHIPSLSGAPPLSPTALFPSHGAPVIPALTARATSFASPATTSWSPPGTSPAVSLIPSRSPTTSTSPTLTHSPATASRTAIPVTTQRPPNAGWDRTRPVRLGREGESVNAESKRVALAAHTGGRLGGSALFSNPYLTDAWLNPTSGCVHTVSYHVSTFGLVNLTLAFPDAPDVYSRRGRGEEGGSSLGYDNITLQEHSERYTTGYLCSPGLVGLPSVDVVFSLPKESVKDIPAPIPNFVSNVVTLRPVPKPPGVADLVMCSFIGTALDATLSWVQYWHAIGVGHFFIYALIPDIGDNRLDPALLALVDDGLVTLIDMDLSYYGSDKVVLGQMTAINSCLWRYRDTAKMMAFFDTDEYFVFGPKYLPDVTNPDGHGNVNLTLLSWLGAREKDSYYRACAKLQSWYGVARNKVVTNAHGSIPLDWLLRGADWMTGGPSVAYRTKCIVQTSWILAMGIHQAPASPLNGKHYSNCYNNLLELSDAGYVHAVNLKSSHQSFNGKQLEDAVAADPKVVKGSLAMLQMVKHHGAKPALTPRKDWPPQVGVEPYTGPARHEWRRRLRAA